MIVLGMGSALIYGHPNGNCGGTGMQEEYGATSLLSFISRLQNLILWGAMTQTLERCEPFFRMDNDDWFLEPLKSQ